MSLLEDVFLQDEAGEAQELERIIEGDEYDERPRQSDSDENSEKEDEAEEDKRRVDPASAKPKRVVKNPRFILNPARLTGPRGIQIIPDHFKDFKFKGKGHEKEDLDIILKKLEHWAYRLYPKFQFEDCLKKIETLGKKRPVMVHLHKIRTDQFTSEETVVQRDSSDDEAPVQEEDEFDKLLQQQIDLARATPAPMSARKPAFSTPMVDKSLTMPKATSSPSISEEQRERMIRNRQLAEERRLARLKQNTEPATNSDKLTNIIESQDVSIDNGEKENDNVEEIDTEDVIQKHTNNRSNVLDSSDEDDSVVMNESITVDVHSNKNDNDRNSEVIDTNDVESHVINEELIENNTNSELIDDVNNTEIVNENMISNNDKDIEEVDKTNESKISGTNDKELTLNTKRDSEVEKTDKGEEIESHKEKIPDELDLMDVDFSDDF